MKINYSLINLPLLLGLMCGILLSFTQCKSSPEEAFKAKGGLRLWVELDEASFKTADEAENIRSLTMDVLFKRIASYGVTPHIIWLEDKNRILLELPGVKEPERVLDLLESNGNLEFWETYNLTDIYRQLVEADERLANLLASTVESNAGKKQTLPVSDDKQVEGLPEDDLEALLGSIEEESEDEADISADAYAATHPLFAKLQLNMYQEAGGYALVPGPIVGYAMTGDKDQITAYLNMKGVKLVLPKDLFFKWGVKSIDEQGELYELYALKRTMREGAVMDGSVITEAKAEPDFSEKYAISLQMNGEGARQWARVTRDNIGKCIAMVVDDKVYSAPNVMSEITGGRSMISGNFTKEEAKDLANMLRAGRMPVPITIVEHKIIPPAN